MPRLSRSLLIALSLPACSGPAEDAPLPNVILISLDTVRADHVGCYGYDRPTTPNLDALAAGATRYELCLATAPWTVPTHASMFTGKHPFEHGAYSYEVDVKARNVHKLDDAHVTLAEILAQNGYATAGFCANTWYLDEQFQLNQGFEVWDVERQPVGDVSERALAWVEGAKQPFFLFVNYMDAHRPYNIEPVPGEEPFPTKSKVLLDAMIERVMVEGAPPGDLAPQVIEHYDRAIRNLDLGLGAFFERLKELGVFDDSVIIVTSDHGEYFGEHGLVEHSKDLYIEGLSVPLVVKAPRQSAGRVESVPASSVDLPRLILAEVSKELEARMSTRFPYTLGNHPLIAENYFSRSKDLMSEDYGERFRRTRATVHSGGYKYVHSSDGAHELYRLADDPGETKNRIDEEPEVAKRLADGLEKMRSVGRWDPGVGVPIQMSGSEEDEGKALGYVGGDEDE